MRKATWTLFLLCVAAFLTIVSLPYLTGVDVLAANAAAQKGKCTQLRCEYDQCSQGYWGYFLVPDSIYDSRFPQGGQGPCMPDCFQWVCEYGESCGESQSDADLGTYLYADPTGKGQWAVEGVRRDQRLEVRALVQSKLKGTTVLELPRRLANSGFKVRFLSSEESKRR